MFPTKPDFRKKCVTHKVKLIVSQVTGPTAAERETLGGLKIHERVTKTSRRKGKKSKQHSELVTGIVIESILVPNVNGVKRTENGDFPSNQGQIQFSVLSIWSKRLQSRERKRAGPTKRGRESC